MANRCDTTYKICGSRKYTADLWHYLKESGVESKSVQLNDMADYYGIDYMKENISVRGVVYYADLSEGEDDDVLTVCTDTAWSGCHDLFRAINEQIFFGELVISYLEVEPGCGIYCAHDEGGFFDEPYYVTACGDAFGEEAEGTYKEAKDVIELWCRSMQYDRGDKTDAEMVDIINDYEYQDCDSYFYINEIIYE